jgi:MoxR-like ATPase
MVVGAKARAVMHGRTFVSQEDIRAVAPPVLRHRIKTNFAADAEGITADEIIRRLIATVRSTQEHENDRDRGQLASVLRAADAG